MPTEIYREAQPGITLQKGQETTFGIKGASITIIAMMSGGTNVDINMPEDGYVGAEVISQGGSVRTDVVEGNFGTTLSNTEITVKFTENNTVDELVKVVDKN